MENWYCIGLTNFPIGIYFFIFLVLIGPTAYGL